MSPASLSFDVLIVGGGNAALVSALTAHECGARVCILEAAPKAERGGNSRFAGAIFRIPHAGISDIEPLLHASAKANISSVRLGPYTKEDYRQDMVRTSKGRCDKEKMEIMFDHALETVTWMKEKGVKWQLTLNKFFDKKRVAKASVSGVFNMPPGGALMAMHEGVGLTDDLWAAVEKTDIKVLYSTPVCELLTSGDTARGVRTRQQESFVDFEGQVILACGGFEASPRLRRQYLGEGWDLVVVRGSRFNTGTMMESAIASRAGVVGHWGGCHFTPQDLNAPKVDDLAVTDKMSRYSYPYSIMVNLEGKRFMDEGENQFGLTYAKVSIFRSSTV
jgi:tricarballylate dehydrogenase